MTEKLEKKCINLARRYVPGFATYEERDEHSNWIYTGVYQETGNKILMIMFNADDPEWYEDGIDYECTYVFEIETKGNRIVGWKSPEDWDRIVNTIMTWAEKELEKRNAKLD